VSSGPGQQIPQEVADTLKFHHPGSGSPVLSRGTCS